MPDDNNELEKQVISADVDYESWMREQPVEFVEDSLGVGKADAFLGGEPLQSFVVNDGRELTLKQLMKKVGWYE